MSSRYLLTALAGVCLLAPARGADQPEDKNAAMAAQLRQRLVQTMQDLRTAQGDLATAQAGQVAAEAKVKELTKSLEDLTKQSDRDKKEAKAELEKKTVDNDELEHELAAKKSDLEKYSAGYKKVVEIANAREIERAKLADENSVLKAKVRDRQSQNLELFRLANEILTRYEKFSVGDALKAREPFTGVTRARLETQVQDYKDKVEDLRTHDEPAKPQPEAQSKQKPAAAPAQDSSKSSKKPKAAASTP